MRMKIIVWGIIAMVLFVITPMRVIASASASTIVYIMPHGTKYHSKGCLHLSDGCSAVTLGTAYRKGYEQCKNCHAPLLNYDDRKKIAEEISNSSISGNDSVPLLPAQSPNAAPPNAGDIYYKIRWGTVIYLFAVAFILLLLFIYISKLKKLIRQKEQTLTDLKADLKIAQARIEMMKEFQNQSNHTKEENS